MEVPGRKPGLIRDQTPGIYILKHYSKNTFTI